MRGADLAAQVASDYTPRFRQALMEFGLPAQLAVLVDLHWNGVTFEAFTLQSRRIEEYEAGDGRRPAAAPVRKALNQLQPVLEGALRARVEEGVSDLVLDGVSF